MKQLLVVAATAAEIGPYLEHLSPYRKAGTDLVFITPDTEIRICITGVGLMAAAYRLGHILATRRFDLAVQAGIAGSFDTTLTLGSLVAVASEEQGDLGAEDREQYLDIFSLGFADRDQPPFTDGKLVCKQMPAWAQQLPQVNSLTVNTASGHQPTIEHRQNRFGCRIESMEGAAFHYACLIQQIPFVQLRSISNYIEPRNRAAWQIGAAIKTLNNFLIQHAGAAAPAL